MDDDERSLSESAVRDIVVKSVSATRAGVKNISVDFKLVMLIVAGIAGIAPAYLDRSDLNQSTRLNREYTESLALSVAKRDERIKALEEKVENLWTDEDIIRFAAYLREESKDIRTLTRRELKAFIFEKNNY